MIHQLEPLFEFDAGETFVHRDATDVDHGFKSVLHTAVRLGALDVVDSHRYRREDMTKTRKVNVYQWDPKVRSILAEYKESMNTLPCGHRAHIYNSPKVPDDKLSCKICAEDDEYPAYEKDTVRELL